MDDLKEMKEYLELQEDGSYNIVLAYRKEGNGWIEVPEGAECFTECLDNGEVFKLWWNKKAKICVGYDKDWFYFNKDVYDYLEDCPDAEILWQRSESEKQAEACENKPFSQCIPVLESAWDKQTGGDHYKKLAIQPMEYALKNKLDYAQANVVKYVTRHADKNGKEDLLKAIHNIELMIEHYYGGDDE